MMTRIARPLALTLSALSLGVAPAAKASSCWTPAAVSAARIGEFDVMLMTTTLRCRALHEDIQSGYERFAKTHRTTLEQAYGRLKTHLGGDERKKGATSRYDRFLIGLANFYGGGETTQATCARFAALAHALGEISDSVDALQSVIFAVVRDPRIDGPRCPSHAEATPPPKP